MLKFILNLKESVRHKHEDSKVDWKILVECTKSKRFYVNQLTSKVRNQLGTNAKCIKADYSVGEIFRCCFVRLKETYEEVVCYIKLS